MSCPSSQSSNISCSTLVPSLSLVVPFFNEEALLVENLEIIYQFLKDRQIAFELIMADDGSVDASLQIAREFAASHVGCIVVSHRPNTGKGGILRRGIEAASMTIVGYIDADLEIPLSCLAQALDCLSIRADVDICAGSKLMKDNTAHRLPHRNLGSVVYNRMVRSMLRSKIGDHQCGLKVFRKRVSDALLPRMKETGWAWDTEFLVLAQMHNFSITQIPVTLRPARQSRVHFFRVAPKLFARLLHLRARGIRVDI